MAKRKASGVEVEQINLAGGVDMVSPALTLAPGALIFASNYEPDLNGGYRRMYGFERFDGRTQPSRSAYYNMAVALTVSVVAGDTITGVTSGAIAVVLQANGTTELIVALLSGTFAAENILANGSAAGVVATTLKNSAATPVLHSLYASQAANYYRALIQKVPGSGPIRGAWYYAGSVYAFRDNAGGTALGMYVSSPPGWTQVTFGREILFGSATAEVHVGDTVTGNSSSASGVVKRVLLRSGTWTSAGVGSLVFDTVSGGPFQNGEVLKVGGTSCATSTSADTAISLLPGGRFQFANYNFSGSTATQFMYFVDGVNPMCEFDGIRLVPIHTGDSPDTPNFLAAWRNMLVRANGTNVGGSSVGKPYNYDATVSAWQEALGGICTGLKPQIGTPTTGTLTVFAQGQQGGYITYNLYGTIIGTTASDANLAIQSPESGAVPYSAQNIGFAYYLDTKGVQQINTSQQFGGFIMSTITRAVQPLIDAKRGLLTASCVVKGSNQYRLFFNDGTGLIVYMQPRQAASIGGTILLGDEVGGLMPIDYSVMGSGWYLNTVENAIDTSGVERVFAGGSDGYVYELNVGTSFDGNPILAYMMMPFNSSKSPRNLKHYHRAVLQVKCLGTANVTVGYDLDYGDGEEDAGYRLTGLLPGQGGIWDIFTWDNFIWDAPAVSQIEIDTPGDGKNLAVLVYGNTDQDLPYTLQNIVLQYIIRRQDR